MYVHERMCVYVHMTMYVCLLRGGFMFQIPIIMSTIMHSKEGGRGVGCKQVVLCCGAYGCRVCWWTVDTRTDLQCVNK